MADEQTSLQESNKEESINLYELFFKYLAYWPWFVAGILLMGVATWVWLRYQAPVYNVTASVLIQEQDQRSGGTPSSSPLAAMQDLGMFSVSNNFDNEVEILRSRTLLKKVVTTLGLYSVVSQERIFGYDIPLYKKSPVSVFMTPEEAEQLYAPVELFLRYTTDGKLSVKAVYTPDEESDEETLKQDFDKLPAVMNTPVGILTFMRNDTIAVEEDLSMKAYVRSPVAVAEAYGADLSVEPASKTTTIAKLSVRNTDRSRAVDFINCLVSLYNQDANDEKNEVAQKTAEFIEERLVIINDELGSTENRLADFKQRSGLTDLVSDAQLALQENSKYNQQRVQNETQISLVTFLRDYINNPSNRNEVIPSNVGLEDKGLSAAIDQYNAQLGERNRLLLTSSEENPAVVKLDANLEAMRRSVQTTVSSVLSGLQITKKDLDRQARKFEGRISQAPEQEKEFMSISRQQEIKAALYTMLLQKREENAITLAATANNGRIIEEPLPDRDPVSPKKKIYYLAALVLGIGIPFGIIYLGDLLKYKIENRTDVERLTNVPVVGEIPLGKKPEHGAIVVHENRNDIMEETFRGLRTNLLFMLRPEERVIMFSSTMPGEGKSFVAGNLAVSLAFMGRKVLIMGMDIRKPGLNKVFNLTRRGLGMTSYLSDPDHTDLFDMIQHSDISPNLDVLPGGPIPPNPTELVARRTLDEAIARLKERYDYLILDTAPIGMVTDSVLISRVADMLVYVCRADYTPKGGFSFINTLRDEHKIPHLATVINSIDMSKRKNSYGYGYGQKYGYGYGKSGYGYGYGYTDKEKN